MVLELGVISYFTISFKMSFQNHMYKEETSLNLPPLFEGDNYPFRKVRMEIFLQTLDFGVCDAVLNGSYIPMVMLVEGATPKTFHQWTPDENKQAQYDVRAQNAILSTVTLNELYKISRCKSAKETWDTLEVTHKEMNEVKRARKNTLAQE